QHGHVRGKGRTRAGDTVPLDARRDGDVGRPGGEAGDELRRRLLAEVDTQFRLVGLFLAVGMVMDLQDKVTALGHNHARAVGQEARQGGQSPAAEAANRRNTWPAETNVTRLAVLRCLRALTALALIIEEEAGVMDDAAVARVKLNRGHHLVLARWDGEDEATVDIGSAGRHLERSG